MVEELKQEFPSQGWQQFLTARSEMLSAYDRAREQSTAHEVEVFHGKVAEAQFRNWLTSFLPKRYGVTSGYIVSTGLKSGDKNPHFDVIIYDQLESPILWVEEFPDVSSQGRSLAIPVEHVRCVLEVKSNFSSSTASDAMNHLKDLRPLMGGVDDLSEQYKLHLPSDFCCGVVFFNLLQKDQFSNSAMEKMIPGIELRGFFGGVILRGESHTEAHTGRITLFRSDIPKESIIGKNKSSLLKAGMSKTIPANGNLHYGSMLIWLEHNFSRFAFDIIAMMQGTYKVGSISSMYGMGASGFEEQKT